MIGNSGIDDINKAAKSCHFPYYVVLVETLPGSGDGDQLAANAINYLSQQWGQRYPSFDMAKSQIFLLAYNPRKYRFLAGSKFEAELNFRNDAHEPYTDIFKASVQAQRKDPKNGIINMMTAVDSYLFDQTDPDRIAARKEAARKEAEERALLAAKSTLGEQIVRLGDLLNKKEYLPNDVSDYKKALADARKARDSGDRTEMLSTAAATKVSADALEFTVNEKERVAARLFLQLVFKWVLTLGAFFLAIFLIAGRSGKRNGLRLRFNKEVGQRLAMVTNASQQFFKLYGDRGDILSLTGVTGKTAELYSSVTKEVDEMYVGVEALRQLTESCKMLANEATFFSLKPLERAIERLDEAFDFDTGQVNKDSLFEPETKVIKISPKELADSLQARFEANVQSWNDLKAAIAARDMTAEQHFPSKTYDALLAQARSMGIPERWLSNHPLAGDDSTDQSLYKSTNDLALTDPVAFVEKLNDLKKAETTVSAEFEQLTSAIELSRSNRLESEPYVGDTVVDPNDDPRTTFALARRAEDQLAGVLAGAVTVEEVVQQAQKADELYRKAAQQAAVLNNAVKSAVESIDTAQKKLKQVTLETGDASRVLTQASKVHKSKEPAKFLSAAQAQLTDGQRDLEKAQRQIGEKRHLNARRNAELAASKFDEAIAQAQRTVRSCKELDKAKAEFEKRLAQMDSTREDYLRKVKRYGGSQQLSSFRFQPVNGPADYLMMMTLLDNVENDWQSAARRAQRDYEEAEAARQAAEAAARREREEEESARRQASYASSSSSSWDSSSGSSWSSGSDSSSGGSWGGGGDSSSGASW